MHWQDSRFVGHDLCHTQCAPAINAGLDVLIGEKLRRDLAYIIDEPIPDCFIELLHGLVLEEEAR